MFSIAGLIAFLIIVLLVLFWSSQSRIKEIALNAVRNACEQRNLQLLDESVHFDKFRLQRNENGRLCIIRRYHFYYFDGDVRNCGNVVMSGCALTELVFANKQPSPPPSINYDNVIPFKKPFDG